MQAAGIVVNSNADTVANDGVCTLREAITSVNTDTASGVAANECAAGSVTDAITFSANYTITLVGSQLPVVTTAILINGNGAANTIIQANVAANTATYRVFEIDSTGYLALDSLTLQNGRCNSSCDNQPDPGGGILNIDGSLTITNSVIKDNKTLDSGGGIFNLGSTTTLNVYNTAFLNNTASNYDGGGINNNGSGATASIVNSTFSGNNAGGGGLMNNGGTSYIYNSTFSGNFDGFGGGALATYNSTSVTSVYNTILANSTVGTDCWNGAVAGTLTGANNLVESTNVQDCNAITASTAELVLSSLTGSPEYFRIGITSPARNAGDDAICSASPVGNTSQNGVTRPQGNHCDIGSYEIPSSTMIVNSNTDTSADDGVCTLREALTNINNGTHAYGSAGECAMGTGVGKIDFAANYTITLGSQLPAVTGAVIINGNGATNTIVQANAAPNTATYRVFQVSASGDLILNNVTVRYGRCNGSCTVLGVDGGGILNQGVFAINNSLITMNTAIGDGGGGLYNYGGDVTITTNTFYQNSSTNAGGVINNDGGTMVIANSTIASNSATGNTGGGIANYGALDIYNSTISGNTSVSVLFDGDNIYQGSGGVLNLYNTIVANSTSHGDCFNDGGTVFALNSLIESTESQACGLVNGSNGNIIGSPSNLGSLTGSPAYFPLNTGSPAINTGSQATCNAAPVNNTSQNGLTRPQGFQCDIGSFELFLYSIFLPLIIR